MDRLVLAAVVVAILFGAAYAALAALAARLPPGLVRDLVAFLPSCVTFVRRLRRDERVPRVARLATGVAVLWVLSPVDLVPEFLPVIGPLDDLIVVVSAVRFAARRVSRAVLLDAWPGERRLLERLLGPGRAA